MFVRICSPHENNFLPRIFVTNNPRAYTSAIVRRSPNPGISMSTYLRNGDVTLSRNSKVIFKIQYVIARGAIAKIPVRKTFLKCCHIILFYPLIKLMKYVIETTYMNLNFIRKGNSAHSNYIAPSIFNK